MVFVRRSVQVACAYDVRMTFVLGYEPNEILKKNLGSFSSLSGFESRQFRG